ncbi:alpha/beta hydrolase [Aureimonas pseudogalii]|uniref:Pimeloyl-ACP methyl ester carboxylesterase n=1 Tax=Aureimonas pseudogalii TaxID=1744844 RepID=A0A7W6H2A2_9HYPH|nr:alpha/beta hydrolase [Aureimonas pseudogalii]MBB3996826.1 pimeloyl-ACP methyl ester carboxylesterase [Aureimonas pseudogalii]
MPENVAVPRPTFVLLHFLGGSAREWRHVRTDLNAEADTLAVDLPGFGDAAGIARYSVDEMADHVVAAIVAAAPARWILVGHSMGAKVAMAITRRIEDGVLALPGLAGLALVAGSPPAPEPMEEERRARMLGWFKGSADESRRQAEEFVDANVVALGLDDRALAVEEVLRLDRRAWEAWLESGSKEDWRERIGVLATPALIVSGGEDADLGPVAQDELTRPHFRTVHAAVLEGAKHLLPLERAEQLARLLLQFAGSDAEGDDTDGPDGETLDSAYRDLIASDRVSPKLRAILLDRARPDDPAYAPQALTAPQFATLRRLVERLIPQETETPIDLAARLDAMMAEATGNGWRFEALPTDPDAYRHALDTLAELPLPGATSFAESDEATRDETIRRIAAGEIEAPGGPGRLDGAGLTLWFQEVLSDALRLYAAHPATMARIGYSGIANGGPGGAGFQGFRRVGIGEREPFEPLAAADRAR